MSVKYTEAQQKAINCIDKNLQIIACAGSGKTQVISARIVNLLKSGVNPSEVVAFTYTEKAGAELQSRIFKLCEQELGDVKGLSEMYIGTIHSWCLSFLQDNVFEFQKYSILDSIKNKLFIDRYYKESGMVELELDRYKDTDNFISIMSILRESEIDITKFADKDEVLLEALEKYESLLRRHYKFDFTFIMTEMNKQMSENPNFTQLITSKIKYLVVDEYQDVNPVQEKIIKNLSNLGLNICVVGDDDQTIFQWRGSDNRLIQEFRNNYPNVEYVVLSDNFRSSPGVVNISRKCISNNQFRLEKDMVSKGNQRYELTDILYNQYDDLEEENNFLVNTIKNIRGIVFEDKPGQERGLDYSDIAILVRSWSKANKITEVLEKADIPFVVNGVNNLFQTQEAICARSIFEYLSGESLMDKSLLIDKWQGLSTDIDKNLLQKAVEQLDRKKPERFRDYSSFILQDIYLEFLQTINLNEGLFTGVGSHHLSNGEIVLYNLGMFSQMIDDFENVYFTAAPKYKMSQFIQFLDAAKAGYYPEGWLNNAYHKPNAVQIMTIHQSKGLEFPAVFIPGLNKNYMPSVNKQNRLWKYIDPNLIPDYHRYDGDIEDERRLMYVALSRSKKFLFISRAYENKMKSKESIFGKEISKSKFQITEESVNADEREKIVPAPANTLQDISLNFSLLKSFFDDPYLFKVKTFYGFRSVLSSRMGYGRSIHNMLMELHRRFLEGENVDFDNLDPIAKRHFYLPYASEKIESEVYPKAKENLELYYKENKDEFSNIEFAEKDILIDLGEGVLVKGRIDLVKKYSEDGLSETVILDFKSSKDSQTETATIEQLQIYALGYNELTGENPDTLEIHNLDENSIQRQRIKKGKLEEMKEKIVQAAENIRNNDFVADKSSNWINSLRQLD